MRLGFFLREAMRAASVAVARTVLFRRVRSVLVRAHADGLIATTLKPDFNSASEKDGLMQ